MGGKGLVCCLGEDERKNKRGGYRDGQVVATSQLGDFAFIAETGAHDNGFVAVFFVVVEDSLDAVDSRVFVRSKVSLLGRLVPVEDSADKRGDEKRASFSGRDGLREREHEGQVAIDAMVLL